MCFSATASFGISAALMAGGVSALKKVTHRSQIPFAAIPILFSVQQFIEGFVWLSLINPAYFGWHQFSTTLFLFFAEVCWPIWVPLAIRLVERDPLRRKILSGMLIIGVVFAVYLTYILWLYPATSMISNTHIRYQIHASGFLKGIGGVIYFIPTVMSFFVSSVKRMVIMGSLVFISFIVSKMYFGEHVISVWCYYAAVISIVIIMIMHSFQQSSEKLKSRFA